MLNLDCDENLLVPNEKNEVISLNVNLKQIFKRLLKILFKKILTGINIVYYRLILKDF